tara:strand:- start:2101 stop:2388 length:288 start_codon:yes stop_codon:yes gene_type:complete
MYYIGQFLLCDRSRYPVVVVNIDTRLATGPESIVYLVSKREFGGDYTCVSYANNTRPIDLDIYQKCAEIGKYGDWWYSIHKDIYQSMIIQLLNIK